MAMIAALVIGPTARAQRPAQAPSAPKASPAALAAFLPELQSFAGRWSDGNCGVRWNDWSISGLEITFHDQSGGVDVERVVDLQPGAFVTQSVATSHGAAASLWRYQPIFPEALQVQNVSRGMSFLLRRCSPHTGITGVAGPGVGGTAATAPNPGASTRPQSPPGLPTQAVQNDASSPSAGSNAAQNAVGPSFDCQKAHDAVAATICSDPTLKLLDLQFNQAYQALRFQLPEDQRPTLRQDAVAFSQTATQACRLPSKGVPDAATMARAAPCLAQAYRSKRADFLGRLSGDAAQEAWRSMPRHIALQNRLVETGLIAASGSADGVYGAATRDAITRFQTQRGFAPSGFMTDATADALTRVAQAGPDTPDAQSDLSRTQAEIEATTRQLEESQRRLRAMLAEAEDAPDHRVAGPAAAKDQQDQPPPRAATADADRPKGDPQRSVAFRHLPEQPSGAGQSLPQDAQAAASQPTRRDVQTGTGQSSTPDVPSTTSVQQPATQLAAGPRPARVLKHAQHIAECSGTYANAVLIIGANHLGEFEGESLDAYAHKSDDYLRASLKVLGLKMGTDDLAKDPDAVKIIDFTKAALRNGQDLVIQQNMEAIQWRQAICGTYQPEVEGLVRAAEFDIEVYEDGRMGGWEDGRMGGWEDRACPHRRASLVRRIPYGSGTGQRSEEARRHCVAVAAGRSGFHLETNGTLQCCICLGHIRERAYELRHASTGEAKRLGIHEDPSVPGSVQGLRGQQPVHAHPVNLVF